MVHSCPMSRQDHPAISSSGCCSLRILGIAQSQQQFLDFLTMLRQCPQSILKLMLFPKSTHSHLAIQLLQFHLSPCPHLGIRLPRRLPANPRIVRTRQSAPDCQSGQSAQAGTLCHSSPEILQQQSCDTDLWKRYASAHIKLRTQRMTIATGKLHNLPTLHMRCLSRQAPQ